MVTNKDTVKALNAATTLIKYCNKYKHCNKCVFYKRNLERGYCAVNFPHDYKEVTNE